MNSITNFIDYCDSMMIANEKGLNLFHNQTLAEMKERIKAGETKFTCNCNIDGRDVPCKVDISNFNGKAFKHNIIANKISYLLGCKKLIAKALNYKYFDATGMPWSKKGDRVKDMNFYWKSLSLTVGKRNAIDVDGIIHFENIKKDIPYNQIRPLVDKYIAEAERGSAYASGLAVGTFI